MSKLGFEPARWHFQPSRLVRVQRSRNAPGPVRITLETHEVTATPMLTFCSESGPPDEKERCSIIKPSKIVNGNPGESSEILELPLLQKEQREMRRWSQPEIEEAVPKGTPVLTIRGTNGVFEVPI